MSDGTAGFKTARRYRLQYELSTKHIAEGNPARGARDTHSLAGLSDPGAYSVPSAHGRSISLPLQRVVTPCSTRAALVAADAQPTPDTTMSTDNPTTPDRSTELQAVAAAPPTEVTAGGD